ncbi:MAG: Fic family protein [Nanoarchaeota archaeon]|nr:Fic family protein [Nanoarchaeota archaeon]MBU4116763.1 Fic family protein [Nanoarchaeota archaeon]
MVEIKKRHVGNKDYYYIEHSFREKGKIQKKQKYLGKELPKNIDKIKKEFISELYYKKWLTDINIIKRNFSKEQKIMPNSAKEKEKKTFAVKFTYNSQRIEGSTLTLKETVNLLEKGITPREKSLDDAKEAESHEKVFYEILKYKKNLSWQAVLYWHKKLLENTKKDLAGKIRNHQVAISGSKFMPPFPAELYALIEEFFSWYKKNKDKLHPVELAALVHLKFVTIHPFSDGNGRISRMMMNFVLKDNKFPLLDISYGKRTSYYNALERAQINKQEGIFLQWCFKRYIQEYSRYLKEDKQ